MQVEYTGRQVVITTALRQLAEEGLARIAKVVGNACSAHVVLTAEKYRQIAEITVQCRQHQVVGICESPSMETALRDALGKVESQAVRRKDRQRAQKRQPKEEKHVVERALTRPRRNAGAPRVISAEEAAAVAKDGAATRVGKPGARAGRNGSGVTADSRKGPNGVPVTVHSPAERAHIAEPHVVHSTHAVAGRPMTLEEAVKEAEFRDRDVFVFRNNVGVVNVLHRKRDGTMELIEAS